MRRSPLPPSPVAVDALLAPRPDENSEAPAKPLPQFSGGDVLEFVTNKLAPALHGRPEADVLNAVWAVRALLKRRPADKPEHAMIVRRMSEATGMTKKELDLPPPVETDVLNDRASRRRDYESSGASDLIDPDNGQSTAQRFLQSTWDAGGWAEIARFMGEFFLARGTHYEPVSDEEITARLYAWLATKRGVSDDKPIKPDRALVEVVLHAVKAEALLP